MNMSVRFPFPPDARIRQSDRGEFVTGANLWLYAAILTASMICAPLRGQSDNPVYVDDSPQAWERFQRARDQTRDNAPEAVRLLQELLDETPIVLVPGRSQTDNLFVTIRHRVLDLLAADEFLLGRYRTMQRSESERQWDAGEIDSLARSRSLTRAGLRALLRLGQEHLEAGHFHSSLTWLREAEDHPDLDSNEMVHLWRMIGLAARFCEDDALFQESRRRLSVQDSPAARATAAGLKRLAAAPPPSNPAGFTIHDRPPASAVSDLVAQSIWTIPLEESLLRRRWPEEGETDAPGYTQRLDRGDIMPATASVAGDLVFINQGHETLAVNRLTGAVRWRHREQRRRIMVERDTDPVLDLNVVAVGSGSVVTLNGHAYANRRTGDGRIVCLDADTGVLRWQSTLAGIRGLSYIKGYKKLFPHGSPVIAEDTVYFIARKINDQYLTSCYVIALHLDDGRYKWSRHVCSSGGLNRGARNISSLTEREGDLYIATPVGAIARFNGATGDTVWLRRFHAPLNTLLRSQVRRPWEISSPVVTGNKVVAIRPDRRRIVVLDRATGELTASYSARTRESWNSPAYLLGNDRYLFAISDEIRAFDLDNLDPPIWTLPGPAPALVPGEEPSGPGKRRIRNRGLRMRGRVQMIEGGLVIPTGDEVLIVDEDSGVIRRRLDADRAGNPLAVDAQLILAGGDRLDMYMSFSRAEGMLRERIAAHPHQVDTAISLLKLGLRVNNIPLVLESATLALSALDQAPPESLHPDARRTLFAELLSIVDEGVFENLEHGEHLFTMLKQLADDPRRQVEFTLAYGDWLTERAPLRALEQYQSILDEPRLGQMKHSRDYISRSAASIAGERISRMIPGLGPKELTRRDDAARRELEAIQARGEATPLALTKLANRFPFTRIAVDAARESLILSPVSTKSYPVRVSLSALARLDHPELPLSARRRLLGSFAEHTEALGWTRLARQSLVRAAETLEPATVITTGGPAEVGPWRERLGETNSRPPRVGEIHGPGRTLPGMSLAPLYVSPSAPVISTHHQPAGDFDSPAPTDRALLVDNEGVLHLIMADSLEDQWTKLLDDPNPQVLQFDQDHLLLWLESDALDPRAVMLDPANGDILWTTPKLSAHIGDPIGDLGLARAVRKTMPDGRPFDPRRTLPLIHHDSLILIRGNGGMLALDLDDGQTVLWTVKPSESLLHEVHMALVQDYGIILAGAKKTNIPRRDSRVNTTPALVLIDPERDGRLFMPYSLSNSPGVRWLIPGAFGSFFFATDEGITCVDGLSGQIRWSNAAPTVRKVPRAWSTSADRGTLVIEDASHFLRLISPTLGTFSDPLPWPELDDSPPLELHSLTIHHDRMLALYRNRFLCYSATGRLIGAEVINDPRNYQWLFPAQDRLLLVNLFATNRQLIADQKRRNTFRTYRIHQMSDNALLIGETSELDPLPNPLQRALLIDGWLLLSTSDDTLAIPMPPK